MARRIMTGTDSTSTSRGVSAERLARASMAAGFAMVEGLPEGELPEEPARELEPGAVRRTWHTLEHFLAHFLGGASGRPAGFSAS
jgi:hypothetical protein